MTEQEFILRFEKEIPLYRAWGKLVTQTILDRLSNKIGDKVKAQQFLKVLPEPRIKETDSLIDKAFYRNKQYIDPYEQITDKVGTRFVVLLLDHIQLLCDIIESEGLWQASKDRDFEEEKMIHPLVFDYQSVHYIVRSIADTTVEGVAIPRDTACEVQIRTLLQHAHSELTHDIIYKPRTRVLPEVVRVVGRSMALIEATDEYFKQVVSTINLVEKKMNEYLNFLKDTFKTIVTSEVQTKFNYFVLDAFRDIIAETSSQSIIEFIEQNPFLKERIQSRQKDSLIYRQPVVLLLYYLISTQKNKFRELWPLSESEMQPLFTDLGIALE